MTKTPRRREAVNLPAAVEDRVAAMEARYDRGLDIWTGEPFEGEELEEWVNDEDRVKQGQAAYAARKTGA